MIAKIVSFVSAAVGIVCWFFPNIIFIQKLCIFLTATLVATILQCIALYLENRDLRKNLTKATENRRALADEFTSKNNLLCKYRSAINRITSAFLIAMQTDESDKIGKLYSLYIMELNFIQSGGFENE